MVPEREGDFINNYKGTRIKELGNRACKAVPPSGWTILHYTEDSCVFMKDFITHFLQTAYCT